MIHEGFDKPTIDNNVRQHQRFWTRNKGDTHPLTLRAPAQVGSALPSPPTAGGSDTPVASMLPGQLKLQPSREAPELFQRLRLLKNTHYTSEGRCVQGLCLLVWVYKPWFHEWDAELLTRVPKKQQLWIQLNLRRF